MHLSFQFREKHFYSLLWLDSVADNSTEYATEHKSRWSEDHASSQSTNATPTQTIVVTDFFLPLL